MKDSATSLASAAITIFLTGCIVIAHDLLPDFRQFFILLTGHHWISASLITIILFIFCLEFLLISKRVRKFLKVYDMRLWSNALMAVTLIMILVIFAELTARFLAE